MKITKLAIVASIIAAIATLTTTAQNSVNSPYSRLGYGILNDNVSSAQRAMGGVGYGMNSGRQINVMNPASYAAIDTLTFLFDIGGNISQTWSSEPGAGTDGGNATGKDLGGGLNYITMQFPLGKYMGGSAGLLPYSQVGYSFGDIIYNGDESTGVSSRQGSGGINQLYIGVAGRPYKGLTVGANISYMFGNILNDNYVTTTSGEQALFERLLKVTDYKLDFGVQYSFNVKPRHRLTAGVVYSPGKSFHGHTYGVHYSITGASSDNTVKPDTTGYSKLAGKYTMPDTWGVGLNYKWDERLMVEADFTYQPWSKVKYQPLEGYETSQKFADRWKVNAGIEFTPRPRGGYLKRIQYRAGAFFTRDYQMVGKNNVKEYGATLGFGFPTANTSMQRSIVNLSFEFRHRQASPQALIKENCFMITLGVNFNEMWFFQNKIN
ncbi:MAG: hypothetical protein NC082_03565 [Clostridiales bacterium]|nr:hypothetical protein [Clostridiales bacterium]